MSTSHTEPRTSDETNPSETDTAITLLREDNWELRTALWHIHTLLTSDGGDKVTPAQIIQHIETVLRWRVP